ncbi:restriction endonuclease (plasmid) [Natrinema zhouii]|uniref:restriction endonuclease n=1 Tax=Natrinema zhouii TaxID=1710539 RepID=UPI001CFFA3E5|nr:restriction endonuclease [Natrinema zhouii]UHQ98251.1 restriction endonuclease [Natrinema zhouii]
MECPSCGDEIEDGSQFCRFCGEELPAVPGDFDLKTELQSMDDYEFEHFVGDLWEEMGWDCEVSTASNDKGIDVRARKTAPYEQKALIQAKRYTKGNKVGSPDIQQYSSLKHQEANVDKVIMVTSSSYSRNAEELAGDLNVKLIDGDDLVNLIDQAEADHLIEDYFDVNPEEQVTEETESEAEVEEVSPVETYEYRRESPNTERDSETDREMARSTANSADEDGEIPLPDTIWTTVIGTCTAGWVMFFVLEGVIPDTLLGFIVFVSWIGLPIGIFMDSRATREVAPWPKYRKTYLFCSAMIFFGLLVGCWYLLLRKAVKQGHSDIAVSTPSTATAEKNPQTSADDIELNVTMHGPGHAVGKDYEFEHHSDALGKIQELKDEERYEELDQLLQWCINETEQESRRTEQGVVPHFYEELAKLYRQHDMYEKEIKILEQFAEQEHAPGKKPRKLLERLGRARQLAEQ